MDRKPNQKKYSLLKDLLQAISLLMIIAGFLLYESYKMMRRDVKDAPEHLSMEDIKQKEIIRIAISTIRDQKNSYIENGIFSTEVSNRSIQPYKQYLNESLTKTYLTKDKFVIIVTSSEISQNVIGVLNIKSNQNLTNTNINNSKQGFKFLSFICTPNIVVEQSYKDIDISSINNVCPNRYIKRFENLNN